MSTNRDSAERRALMLREMGLSPQWHLRGAVLDGAAATPVMTESVATSEPVPVAATVIAATPAAVTLDAGSRRGAIMRMEWTPLKASVASCTSCPLHAKRNKTVFGVGDENADWLFVGEGPGADEDEQGEPFVGQAGKLLDSMLAAVKLNRQNNVYIANVVKCRPPGNRNPAPDEALACEPYLHRQIELIKPKLIVALGKVAAVNLLGREDTVARMRNKVHQYRGIPLIVTYHPAYLLRSLAEKARAWEDLCFALDTMAGLQNSNSETI